MRKISVAGLASIAMLACNTARETQDPAWLTTHVDPTIGHPLFELTVWGMPGATRFHVQLTADNRLAVTRETLPITQKGLTQRREFVQLTSAQSDELVRLAKSADDWSNGCAVVADGTSAELRLWDGGGDTTRRCENASEWPKGDRTRAFLDRVNSHLSKEMHVY